MEIKAPEDKPSASDVWMRGLFMLLLMIGFAIGQWLLIMLHIVQYTTMFSGPRPAPP